jgi:site-specific recombinase XerD
MINRENWQDTKDYLDYLRTVLQQDEQTVKRRREQLRHLLEWADSVPFARAREIDPTFPVFLLTSRYDGKKGGPSPESLKSTCGVVRKFFTWARREWPRKYAKLNASWVDTLRPARSKGMQTRAKGHQFYTLDEMRLIAAVEPSTLLIERDRAMMAFLYLSGARASAFVTLPISCVRLEEMAVDQFAEMGVHTKNHKSQTTYLLPIPELLQIVQEWDDKVRSQLPESAMWYSGIHQDGETLAPIYTQKDSRREKVADGIKHVCKLAGVEFKSTHKFRHGHTVYVRSMAKTISEFMAASRNLMHESVSTTERVYAQLTNSEVKSVIANMKPKVASEAIDLSEMKGMNELAKVLKEHPGLLDALSKDESD